MDLPRLDAEVHIRRVRRADLRDLAALLEEARLPAPATDRATRRRFRNVVADLGCDFDVAIRRERVRGFVHVAYARDLLLGNRAQLLALAGASDDVRATLLAAAIDRATRRHCRDITALAGPWMATDLAAAGGEWQRLDGCWRLALAAGARAGRRDLPADAQTCRG